MNLTLGYSPCPNDTFMFYALTHGRVEVPGITVSETLADVETLNQRALDSELDLTKVSFHALAYLREDYCLLHSGAALGRGCGPLVVARAGASLDALRGVVAVPGLYTTAYLLLKLYGGGLDKVAVMPFDSIMSAVARGEAEAGLVIHEGRFTYGGYGLVKLLDLGEWWEAETGLPLPLGGILARRALGRGVAASVERAVKESILWARAHGGEAMSYIKEHAQEMDDDVVRRHIALYVNDFSLDLGAEGMRAVERLFGMAAKRGVLPASSAPLFL